MDQQSENSRKAAFNLQMNSLCEDVYQNFDEGQIFPWCFNRLNVSGDRFRYDASSFLGMRSNKS